MNRPETVKIMKGIQSIYKGYYKTEEEVRIALNIMDKVFENWEFSLIDMALLEYMKTSATFPPVPGQLIELAKDLKTAELRQRQIESIKLPEPAGEQMSEKLREMYLKVTKEVPK